MKFSSKKIIILVIVLALLVGIGFFAVKKINQKKAPPILGVQPFWANQQVNQGQPVDAASYQQSLRQIIVQLMADLENPTTVRNSYEKILTLAVPNQYRQLHLSLVLTLAKLTEPAEFEQGRQELEQLLAEESWLLTQ